MHFFRLAGHLEAELALKGGIEVSAGGEESSVAGFGSHTVLLFVDVLQLVIIASHLLSQ